MYKIGYATDIHNLTNSNLNQKFGGLNFKVGYKIVAHSDGDIILHVIAEAIIGALGLGDLGDYFPDNDSNNKGLDSLNIVKFSFDLLKQYNFEIVNIDLTIVCEKIIFKHIKKDIKDNLCKLLSNNFINLKATRFEIDSNQIQCNCAILLKKII